MRITCFIRYQIDPAQRDAFREYAECWARIIPRCRGELVADGAANFEMARTRRFIVREERTFLEAVDATYNVPPAPR